ncbi:MAG: alkaline phosphatase family protein [Candidatus Thermoplasmatota archaeon]
MVLPDYEEKSLVNLMSSVLQGIGADSPYETLPGLEIQELRESRNVVLLVLDGIGYEYLKEKGKDTILYEHLEEKLTSVFPSSTASAIPTLFIGLAPQKHAVTGWYTLVKEVGVVSTILPFEARFGEESLSEYGVDISTVLSYDPLMEDISRGRYDVTLENLKGSEFNSFYGQEFEQLGYSSLDELFQVLERVLKKEDDKKFIRGYWDGFDTAAHEEGVKSVSASNRFLEINHHLKDFVERIKDTDTTLLITSDHGFIDTEEEKALRLDDHPALQRCLTLPFCGDQRTVFCYVSPSKTDKFENYWEDNLSDFCDLHKSEHLVEKDYFGLFEPDPRLYDRIGDYTLIMKDDYIFYDTLQNEEEHFMIGNHGGTSEKEMYVPLSFVDF